MGDSTPCSGGRPPAYLRMAWLRRGRQGLPAGEIGEGKSPRFRGVERGGPLLIASACLAAACSSTSESLVPGWGSTGSASNGRARYGVGSTGAYSGNSGNGTAGTAGKGLLLGLVGVGGADYVSLPFCTTAGASAQSELRFASQVLYDSQAARRTLYTWTVPEQVADLRKNQVLLTKTETAGLGRGYLFVDLLARADRGDALAKVLTGPLFGKGRYAWPNPWATLMGWPGESYGDQLVKVVLRPEAWIAKVEADGLTVVDLENNPVALTDALAHPERIGAIFYHKAPSNYAVCGSTYLPSGDSYREFYLGNEAMVEEWSIATQGILDRLDQDIALIQAVRPSALVTDSYTTPADYLNGKALCHWGKPLTAPGCDPLDPYVASLALTSEYYSPTSANLDALVAKLQSVRFSPDPLVVKPSPQP